MNERKAGAMLSYVYLAMSFVVGLVYTPFALHYLGDSGYGVFAIATSVVSFMMILDLGFNQTMIRYVAKYKALGDKEGESRLNGLFLMFYTVIGFIALVIGFVLTFFIEDIFAGSGTTGLTGYEAYELKIVFVILLINLVGSFPLGTYAAILNANEGFVVLKLVNILTFVLTYGGMSIALLCGGGTIVLAIITTTVSLVLKLIQGIYVQLHYKPKFTFRRRKSGSTNEAGEDLDRSLVREIFVFSFFIFLNILIDQLYANTDKFILGIVQSSVVVSIYTVGVQFAATFEQFSTSISGVFLPKITELTTKEKDMKKVNEIFVRIGRIQFILLGFLMSGFIVFGRRFIGLWVGEDKLEAYAIALVVIVPAIIPLSQNIGISVIRALNRHRFRSVMYLGIAILNVGLSIPLAIWFGGFGAACATGFGTCLGQILTMNWFYYKKIGLDIPGYWREAGKILSILIPLGAIGFGIHMLPFWGAITVWGGWLSLLLQILIYTLLFLAVGHLFIFNKYESDLLRGILRAIAQFFLHLIPLRDDVMFESHPDFSGNAMTVYEELLRENYNRDHRIYWCLYDERRVSVGLVTGKARDAERTEESIVSGKALLPDNVYLVYKNKPGFIEKIQYIRARARCRYILDSNSYIHKLKKNQIRLHLGHGMPIKLLPEYTNYEEIGACDGYLTCGTYWKEIYTKKGHIPEEILLPIGYPRNDVLVEHSKARKLAEAKAEKEKNKEHGFFWHLHEREDYILWMPTYRQHKKGGPSVQENSDTKRREREAADEERLNADTDRWEVLAMRERRKKMQPKMPYGMPEIEDSVELEELDQLLGDLDMKIYFRPHPAQDMNFIATVALENIRIADDTFLQRLEVSMYELIAHSKALITDYSSVYFDYLLTGNPIGLTLRDAGMFFRDCICCFDDIEEELAGTKLESAKDVMGFVKNVRDGADAKAEREAAKWFHDVQDGTSTERVIAWLVDKGMPLQKNN